MKKFVLQCAVVLVVALLSDIIACVHIQTLVDRNAALSASTVLVLHLMSFFSNHWFVEHATAMRRFLLTLASGAGAGVGTLSVILFFT